MLDTGLVFRVLCFGVEWETELEFVCMYILWEYVLAEYKYYFLECWGWASRLKIDVSTGAQYGLPNLSTHI